MNFFEKYFLSLPFFAGQPLSPNPFPRAGEGEIWNFSLRFLPFPAFILILERLFH
jgi:hypothetical protein